MGEEAYEKELHKAKARRWREKECLQLLHRYVELEPSKVARYPSFVNVTRRRGEGN